MIDGLIAGRLVATPEEHTGKNGRTFVTARVEVSFGAEDRMFVSVICFATDACRALAALDTGDSVALSGELTPKVYTDKSVEARPSLGMTVHGIATAYHARRKREAAAGSKAQGGDS